MVGGELKWSIFAAAAVLVAACGGEDEPAQCYARNLDSADICSLLGDACDPVTGELPGLSEAITVAPSTDMPEGVVSQVSHNNLDIIWHEGRLFLAFRTAPTHFASAEVVMYVVSTADQKTWQLETSFAMNTDLREPRFLSPAEQTSRYNREYWITPKRCSLWKVDGDAQVVDHVLDLPSSGDTCFASAVQLQEDQFLIYNYTSPLDDPNLRWVDGQLGPTSIYRTTLQF